jgi:hypothetical protein
VPLVELNIPKKTKPQQDNTNKAEQQKTISPTQLQTTDHPETRNTNAFGPQSDRPVNVGGSLNLLD